MDMSGYAAPMLPVTAGVGGNAGGIGGGLWGLGGLLVGALLSNGGGGLFGGGGNVGNANLAFNANQSGEIAGMKSSLAQIQAEQENAEILGAISSSTSNIGNLLLRTNDAVDTYAQGVQVGIGNLQTAQAAANYTNLVNSNALGRDMMAQSYQAQLNALNTANISNNLVSTGFNEMGREMSGNQAAIQSTLAAMSAAQALCCCETRQLIIQDGNATRALINANTMQELRDRLNASDNSLSNMNQTNALVAAMMAQTNTIIQHFPHFPVGA